MTERQAAPRRRLRCSVIALVCAAASLVFQTPSARASSACASATSTPATPSAALRPVIFVPGWTSDGGALASLAQALAAKDAGKIQPLYFVDGAGPTAWAGDQAVGGCLNAYIQRVSDVFRGAGGDGKVIVVAYSIGGLTTLYAADWPGAGKTSLAADLGGVITLGTPYLGSPFGDPQPAAVAQAWKDILPGSVLPPAGTRAQQCLGPHSKGAPLPAPCHDDLPPYLPASVPLTEIGGAIDVSREFAFVRLYTVSTGSDGIVPLTSGHGYRDIEAPDDGAQNQIDDATDECTVSSNAVDASLASLGLPGPTLAQARRDAAELGGDSAVMSEIKGGSMDVGLMAYLGALTLAAHCSHIHLDTDTTAVNQAAQALSRYVTALAADDRPQYSPKQIVQQWFTALNHGDKAAIAALEGPGFSGMTNAVGGDGLGNLTCTPGTSGKSTTQQCLAQILPLPNGCCATFLETNLRLVANQWRVVYSNVESGE